MTDQKNKAIIPLSKLHEHMPLTFTKSSVNWLLRKKIEHGFDKILSKIGSRYFVNLDDVANWIESKKSA